MYPKLKKKNRLIELLKNVGIGMDSLSISVKCFLKSKDHLLIFMMKCFHI